MGTSSQGGKVSLVSQSQMVHDSLNRNSHDIDGSEDTMNSQSPLSGQAPLDRQIGPLVGFVRPPASCSYCTVKATSSAILSSSSAATTMCCRPSAM